MENLHEGELSEQTVDLGASRSGILNESWLRMFGGITKMILGKMFDPGFTPSAAPMPSFTGTRSEITSYASALGSEKSFLDAFKKHGLDDPRTYKSKVRLDKSIKEFEKTTGLTWPFKS